MQLVASTRNWAAYSTKNVFSWNRKRPSEGDLPMSNEHIYDEKGKTRPQSEREPLSPHKENQSSDLHQMQKRSAAADIRQMQQTIGNASVQRMLAQRKSTGAAELDEDTTAEIQARRGHGRRLDAGVHEQASEMMDQDFSAVNVHTDAAADHLNRRIAAKAFTVGNDIFFRHGAYDPGSSDGQRLIAHELTHVVQQGATPPAVQSKMTVNDPDDAYEAEADRVADAVVSRQAAVRRQELPEEEESLQMQPDETFEEEEERI
jgi:hypothetical protein